MDCIDNFYGWYWNGFSKSCMEDVLLLKEASQFLTVGYEDNHHEEY